MDGRPAAARRRGAALLNLLSDDTLRVWEFLSYVVTVLGLPLGVFVVWREMRAERVNEIAELEQREDELYVELSKQYSAFLETLLANADPGVLADAPPTSELQRARRHVYYEMLLALFERAFILLHEAEPSPGAARRWASWANYIGWWLGKSDFRAWVIANLDDEDAGFVAFIRQRIAAQP